MAAVVFPESITERDLPSLEVALVHYWLVTWRGGEKVVASLLKIFPKADIYTLFYDHYRCGKYLTGHKVTSSSLNIPGLRKHYQKLFPLYPAGIRSLRLKKKYDLILSSESGPAKGIVNPAKIPHLCYIHTPMRYCWGDRNSYLLTLPPWSRPLADKLFEKLKLWDAGTVDGVDCFVANSSNVAGRVKKYYNREAKVCYPPISLELFSQKTRDHPRSHYLSFGALTPYKNIGLLVDAFNLNKKNLIIIGEGSEKKTLQSRANNNISFKGELEWDKIMPLIHNSRALLFPGEEDFGMIPLEVMSQGIPVIALGKGGALETVVENQNDPARSSGLFFESPTTVAINKALIRFEAVESHFDPAWISNHARSFGEDVFIRNMKKIIVDFLNHTHKYQNRSC